MLRYAIYARLSKDDKSGEIKSIEDQKKILMAVAHEHGLHIVAVYEENQTARFPDQRVIYASMIKAVRSGTVNAILVWHVDRLARNMKEAGELSQLLIDSCIQEIRTPYNCFRPTDHILPLLIEQGSAAQYSINLSKNVTRGITSMLEDGGWPHQAKVGYINVRDAKNVRRGLIEKDPERYDLMRRGFDLMLTGAYTVRQVVDIMNDEWGFRTRTTPTRPGNGLSYAAAYNIFSNPFYAGFTVHNGVQRKGRHDKMITVAEFNRLQQILRERSRPRRKQREYPFTGIIECGYCGSQVTAEHHFKSRLDRVYYHCSDTYLRCTKRGVTEQHIDDRIAVELRRLRAHVDVLAIAHDCITTWAEASRPGEGAVAEQQDRTIAEIDRQRDALLSMMLKGLLTDEETFKKKDAQLLKDRNRLVTERANREELIAHIKRQADAGTAFLERSYTEFVVAAPLRKREIARALATEYTLRERDLTIVVHPLLVELAEFTAQIAAVLEPLECGSTSQDKLRFLTSSYVGRDTETLIEPPASLKATLKEADFPNLYGSQVILAA